MIERVQSPCTAALAPEAKFQSIRPSFGGKLPENASPQLRRACADDGAITPPEPAAQQAEDRSTLCLLFCCCNANPSISLVGAKLKQQCVADSLNQVDRDLGYQSRYKAEISYNMTADPPSPFMHRDSITGADTTQPSTNWIGRIFSEILGFKRASGMVRRPDVVVVNDPSIPPVQSNIAAIYEMKFPGDPEDPTQMTAYNKIMGGGRKATLLDEQNCDCNRRQQEVENRIAMAEQQQNYESAQRWRGIGRLLGLPGAAPYPTPEPFPLPP